MKTKNSLAALIAVLFVFFVFSCGKDTTKKDETTDKTKVTDTTKKTPPVNNDEAINKIKKFREDGEKKLLENKFTRKVINFSGENIKENIKQKWEKMDVYYDGDKVVRIQTYPHKGTTERNEEFYIMDGKLAFAFIQDREKHEGKDMGEPGKEFYFDKDKLIKYENRTDEKSANLEEEMKKYEANLVSEANDYLQIIKNTK